MNLNVKNLLVEFECNITIISAIPTRLPDTSNQSIFAQSFEYFEQKNTLENNSEYENLNFVEEWVSSGSPPPQKIHRIFELFFFRRKHLSTRYKSINSFGIILMIQKIFY